MSDSTTAKFDEIKNEARQLAQKIMTNYSPEEQRYFEEIFIETLITAQRINLEYEKERLCQKEVIYKRP